MTDRRAVLLTPQNKLLADLLDRGEKAIEDLCSNEVVETLHLEFKTLTDSNGQPLGSVDKRLLGKAVSGLANAEGGLVLIGVATGKREDLDFAFKPAPLRGADRLRNRIASLLPELISPIHSGLEAHFIPASTNDSAGFIVIDVPASDGRPHISNPEHRYYRRGSDRTRMMDHSEIRDLFLAERSAQLSLKWRFQEGKTLGNNARELHLVLGLQNESNVAARKPFLRLLTIDAPQALAIREHGHGQRSWQRPDGSMAFFSNESPILHSGDVIEVARVEIIISPDVPPRYAPNPKEPILTLDEMNSPKQWQMSAMRGSDNGRFALRAICVEGNVRS